MDNGWIKLHRSIFDNPVVCKDSDYFIVWCYLLAMASAKKHGAIFNGEKITLEPGQLITGRKKISKKLHVDEYKVLRILKMLKSEQQIAQQTGHEGSLITVLNWKKYQGDAQPNAQQLHTYCTPNAQLVHSYCTQYKKEKKDKKDKKEEKDKKKDFKIVIAESTDSQQLRDALLSFSEFRKGIKKPLTERAVTLLITKLNKMTSSVDEQIEILNQSELNGWQGVFPLRDDYVRKAKNKFNDFPQRENDYNSLEEQLLKRQGGL